MILIFIQKKKKIYLFTTEHQQILIAEFNIIKSPYISIIWPLDHSHPMDGAPRPKVTRKPLQYPTIRVNPTSENFTQENPTCESQETRIFHLVRSVPRSLKGFSRTYQRNFEARVSVRKFLAPNQPISSPCPRVPPLLFHVGINTIFKQERGDSSGKTSGNGHSSREQQSSPRLLPRSPSFPLILPIQRRIPRRVYEVARHPT